MQVAIIGPSRPSEQEAALAERVGQLLAERGAILLSGGEEGTMEAACKGAKEAGGTVVGILGGSTRAEANAFLTVSVVTGISMARNTILIRSADAVISVGCSWGTLIEMGIAIKFGRPLIALSGWHVNDASGTPVDGDVQRVETAEEAVRRAVARAAA
ncbi:MAG: TIGR00725 family protein [Actinobacteria bacterium 13_2_20CM_2_71_6]|nr:MAG: TIGR00725 family protein [Actinobacteria bacterium 13_2_20CM_2_71_6]